MATANPYSAVSKDVKSAFEELSSDESLYIPNRPAEMIFELPGYVQIFFVSPDGKVSTFSEPSNLRIFKFKEQEGTEEWVPTFIQVDGWTHPLIPGASPVLEATNGAFMFPDVYDATGAGASIGIVLAPEVTQEDRERLRVVLQEHTALKAEKQLPADLQLGTIGRTLVSGADYLCKGMELGAKKACELIEYVGEQQKSKGPSAAEAGIPDKVNPALKHAAKGARVATTATVKVSGFVANRVGRLTKGLANYLAAKAEKPVSGAVVSATGGSRSASIRTLVDAARGGLMAFGTVYSGLEDSAKVLGTSLKTHSVTVVEHRYGREAGGVYGDAMTAAGNAAMTYMHVSSLGVKGLAKRTAKDTAKAVGKNVLEAHVDKKQKTKEGEEEANGSGKKKNGK